MGEIRYILNDHLIVALLFSITLMCCVKTILIFKNIFAKKD